MFEFEANYNSNTGDPNAIAIGSGVHLNKDVTFYFSMLDNKNNLIENTQSFRSNSFIKDVTFDILDTDRNTIAAEYVTSANISILLNENENISIFGEYKKDFGVRAKVSNNFNSDLFISEYYVYGNVPKISGVKVIDGVGYKNYPTDPSGTGESINKIEEYINFNISLENDPRYLKLDKVEFYAIKSDESKLPELIFDNLFQTNSIIEFGELNNIQFNKKLNFEYDTFYNFAIVPYSELGSGEAFYIEDLFIKQTATTDSQEIFNTTNNEANFAITKTDSISGEIPTRDKYTIDIFEKYNYKTVSYTTQIIDAYGSVTSSDLKVTISDSNDKNRSGVFISEYAINNDIGIEYTIDNTNSFIYLNVINVEPTGFFRIQRVAM
jgi:hypothetical protein